MASARVPDSSRADRPLEPDLAVVRRWFDHAVERALEHVATLIPPEWLAPAATGTPEQCAAAVDGQFALGADGVILHGAAPAELEPVVKELSRPR